MARKSKEKQIDSAPVVVRDDKGGVLAEYPPEMIETIKATVAKGATDEELMMFLSIANQKGLNPLLKEIWFVKMNGESVIMTSRDGLKKLAERQPNYKKCQSVAVHSNDEFEMEWVMGEIMNITHKFKQNDRGEIIGAYAVLKTTDFDNYATYVDFKEYYQKNKPIWRNYPSAMIRKVAESDVYKRFADANGINDFESMPGKFYKDIKQDEIDMSEEFEPIDIQQVIDDTVEEAADKETVAENIKEE